MGNFLKIFHQEFHSHRSDGFTLVECEVFERVGIPEVDEGWTLYAPDVIPLGFDASFLEEPVDCLHCGSVVHISSFVK